VLGECSKEMKEARAFLDANVRKFCDGDGACARRVCTAARRKCRLRSGPEHEPTLVGNILKFNCANPDSPPGTFFLVGFVRKCPCECVPEPREP
jgi:hypothetical protein